MWRRIIGRDKPQPVSKTEVRDEDEKDARLENAERQVADLQVRADRAINYLGGRRDRNHWRESIQQMIQGA